MDFGKCVNFFWLREESLSLWVHTSGILILLCLCISASRLSRFLWAEHGRGSACSTRDIHQEAGGRTSRDQAAQQRRPPYSQDGHLCHGPRVWTLLQTTARSEISFMMLPSRFLVYHKNTFCVCCFTVTSYLLYHHLFWFAGDQKL